MRQSNKLSQQNNNNNNKQTDHWRTEGNRGIFIHLGHCPFQRVAGEPTLSELKGRTRESRRTGLIKCNGSAAGGCIADYFKVMHCMHALEGWVEGDGRPGKVTVSVHKPQFWRERTSTHTHTHARRQTDTHHNTHVSKKFPYSLAGWHTHWHTYGWAHVREHTYTHARTLAHTHEIHTHARTHARTQTQPFCHGMTNSVKQVLADHNNNNGNL